MTGYWGPSPAGAWGQPGQGPGPAPGAAPAVPVIPGWMPAPKAGSERTGPLPLHPMSLSDILDGAFRLLRANAPTMLVVVATIMVPIEIGLALLERHAIGGQGILQVARDPSTASSRTNNPGAAVALTILTLVVYWIVVPLVCGATSRVVMASYFGRELRPAEGLRAAARRAPALLAATLLVHAMELAAGIACILPGIAASGLFVMTAPVIAIEELGPVKGIRRAARLARRRFWPTLGLTLLAGVLAYALGQILGLIPNTAALLIGLHWGWILLAAGSILVSFVTVPLVTIVATLLYLDARIRNEGLDIEIMTAGWGSSTGGAGRNGGAG